MTAGLLIPIIAVIGAGVDLGQAYMVKTRLQQACDAGVLAGRRAMDGGQFTGYARNAASRMFDANFPEDLYDTSRVSFAARQQGESEVAGTAAATVNTILMHIFGKETFELAVGCTARLEVSNADIMFVLDTTGSMASTNPGDSVNRLSALKTEVLAFFDTVASAQSDDAIIRYGVMPYSSNVNVGRILYAANPSWLATTTPIPSRVANVQMVQDPSTTTNGTATYSNFTQTVSWANTSTYQTGYSSSACNARVPNPLYQDISRIGSPTVTTNTVTQPDGSTVTTTTTTEQWNVYNYRYNFQSSNSRCYLQRRTGTARKTSNSTTTTPAPRPVFQNYTYSTIAYDVSGVLDGSGLNVPAGDGGANIAAAWNGCIMERDTVAFSGTNPPAAAFDLDIDAAPSNASSRWHVALPNIAFPRANAAGSAQSRTPAQVTTTNDYPSYAEGNHVTGGWAACPSQAMRMTAFTAANRAAFASYINGLVAVGGTYHDVGMVWGTRFISPTGIFAGDNGTSANGRPVSRHIIFMTDGEMAPNPGIYGFQGQEYLMDRVGSTNTAELTQRHNNRFLAACQAARSRNITVWVVGFGVALTPEMQACASGNNAFSAANATELRQRFQSIAQQITRLRLSQ